tara:strand:- start:380 stop:781 length:402 start_codon:yes stop_codon:yes gene_type:complete
MSEQHNNRLDGMAVFFSGTCILHCLILPMMVTLFPIIQSSLLEEKYFHLIMLVFILPTSLIALSLGCRRHKDQITVALGTIGLVILSVTAVWGHSLFGFTGERIVTTIGGLILASAHIQNYRCCQHADCEHEE